MNKTTTRLAATGGIIVLGVFALVLAQNDARKREREEPQIEPFAAQVAVPIPIGESDTSWGTTPELPMKQLLVRANNDQLKRYGSEIEEQPDFDEVEKELPSEANPLRQAGSALLEHSEVVLAGAGVPVEPPANGRPTTASPPAWAGGAGVAASMPADLQSPPSDSRTLPPPTLPSFPTSPAASGVATAGENLSQPFATPPGGASLPTHSTALPTLPATLASDGGTAPEFQSGAMPQANLSPPASLPGAAQLPNSMPTPALGANQLPPASALPTATLSTPQLPNLSSGPSAAAGGYKPPNVNAQANAGIQPSPVNQLGGAQSAFAQAPTTQTPGNRESAPLRTAALAGLVSNQPGNRYLDGSQNPNMVIQKRAPEEIQVGKPATFVIAVRNAGNATAHDVRVVDSVPQGSRFVESLPPATPDAQGYLKWDLGEMAAGDERTITLQIVPEVQGEVGSNALVYFAAQASVRTVATLPKLELQLQSQPDMLISSRQQVSVVVKNTGTGVARGVRLEADLPDLLKHDSGEAQLAASLGDMRPNDVQPITLDVSAVAPGQSQIVIRAVSDDGAIAEEQIAIQVLAPNLVAQIEGPKLRYLERQATYQIRVKNSGTAPASNLDFVVHLPTGLKYNSANNGGTYNPAQHTVSWGLYELPAGEIAPIELTVLPVELGPLAISFSATGDLGLKAEAKTTVIVDGLAELAYTIGQDNGTIETGASSTYSVQVTNVGNKADKDVRLAVQLPAGAKLIKVDAQVNYRAEGNQILFDPIPEMRNKDQYTFRFQVRYDQPGTQIVRTQLTSANWPVAVIKEEGTLVYNDQN